MVLGAVALWLTNWLTPIWLLGVGALAGLLLLGGLWLLALLVSQVPPFRDLGDPSQLHAPGVLTLLARPLVLFSRRSVGEVPAAVREGVLWPLFVIVVSLGVFGVVGAFFVSQPLDILRSLTRLPTAGTRHIVARVAVSEPEDPNDEFSELTTQEVPVSLPVAEVRELRVSGDQALLIATRPFLKVESGAEIEVIAGEETVWTRGEQAVNPFLEEDASALYIQNLGSETADVKISVVTQPPHPEVITIPILAVAIAGVFLVYLLQRAAAPRLSAIALAT
jgi:hypothetical protein